MCSKPIFHDYKLIQRLHDKKESFMFGIQVSDTNSRIKKSKCHSARTHANWEKTCHIYSQQSF